MGLNQEDSKLILSEIAKLHAKYWGLKDEEAAKIDFLTVSLFITMMPAFKNSWPTALANYQKEFPQNPFSEPVSFRPLTDTLTDPFISLR